MVTIESLKENIINGWVTYLLIFGVTAACMWALRKLLYIFGKEDKVKPEHRKYLYGIASVLVFSALIFIQNVNSKLADISASSPRRFGFRGGLIFFGPIGNPSEMASSNAMPLTMQGIPTPSTRMDSRGVNMMLVAKIDNAGQPSVAWNWKAKIAIPGGTVIDGFMPGVAVGSNSSLPTIIGKYDLKMEENLIQSMATAPLPTGAGKIGWLVIHIPGITELPDKSTIILTFEDVFGRVTKIEHVWAKPAPDAKSD